MAKREIHRPTISVRSLCHLPQRRIAHSLDLLTFLATSTTTPPSKRHQAQNCCYQDFPQGEGPAHDHRTCTPKEDSDDGREYSSSGGSEVHKFLETGFHFFHSRGKASPGKPLIVVRAQRASSRRRMFEMNIGEPGASPIEGRAGGRNAYRAAPDEQVQLNVLRALAGVEGAMPAVSHALRQRRASTHGPRRQVRGRSQMLGARATCPREQIGHNRGHAEYCIDPL